MTKCIESQELRYEQQFVRLIHQQVPPCTRRRVILLLFFIFLLGYVILIWTFELSMVPPMSISLTKEQQQQKEQKEKEAKQKEKEAKQKEKEAKKEKEEEDKYFHPILKPNLTKERFTSCYIERDFGIIKQLKKTKRLIGFDIDLNNKTTKAIWYESEKANVHATNLINFQFDLNYAQVHRPIQNLSQDGGNHDPRFKFNRIPHCTVIGTKRLPSLVWDDFFYGYSQKEDAACVFPLNDSIVPDIQIKTKALLMARRDDHNPFFMISLALNTWIVLKAMEWNTQDTQIIYMDDGFPSQIDVLHKKLLSPNFPIVLAGKKWLKKTIHFENALIAPFEYSGPMMRHLNDDEPCWENELIKKFRQEVMELMNVPINKSKPNQCIVTVISRRPYSGRNVQRKWLNEDEIVDEMRQDFGPRHDCQFQSIDYVKLDLEEQIRITKESDLLIGMHGAGMVNVLWARPQVQVIEIFPKNRYRWGYRNLCQFIGCEWRQFRGGRDTGKGDNRSNKRIFYPQWKRYFEPIYAKMIRQIQQDHMEHDAAVQKNSTNSTNSTRTS